MVKCLYSLILKIKYLDLFLILFIIIDITHHHLQQQLRLLLQLPLLQNLQDDSFFSIQDGLVQVFVHMQEYANYKI